MMERKKTLLIIPAHNEEKSLQHVFDSLAAYKVFDFADLLVINDASEDQTAKIARNNQAACITFTYNLGYGSALQAGYKYARKYGYEYLIQMDADGQHDACNIRPIYEELCREEGPDIVLASRFIPGSAPYKTSAAMRFGFSWFKGIVHLLGGIRINDSTTGLQGLNQRAFCYYAGYDHFDAKYPDANMILQMHLLGYQMKEIPAVMHSREHGRGMHAGVIRPIKYMLRSTAAVFAVWLRMRLLDRQSGVLPVKQEKYQDVQAG